MAVAAVDQVSQRVEAAPAQQAVVKGVLGHAHVGAGLADGGQHGVGAGLIARKDDPGGSAVSAWRSTLSAGAFRWATVPLWVSITAGLNTGADRKSRIRAMEPFFRLIGRGSGSTWPSCGRTRVSSSDSRRQPLCTSAAHRVLLPEPGGAGRMAARPSFSTTAACSIR